MELFESAHVDTYCRDNLPDPTTWPDLSCDGAADRYPARLNLGEVLLDGTIARHGADRISVIDDDLAWTYGELRAIANRVAHVLASELDVVPGNRVLVWGHNSPRLAATLLAVWRAGAVAVPASPLLTAADVASLVRATRTDLVIASEKLAHLLDKTFPPVARIGYDDLFALAARQSDAFEPVDTAQDDVAFLVSTSGTTGRPKVTVHFHRDLLMIADAYNGYALHPVESDVFTGTPHLSFTYGLGFRLVFPLRAGAATELGEAATTESMLAAAQRHAATVLISSPTAYRSLAAMTGAADRLATVRTAVSSGEALTADVWWSVKRATGIEILEELGTTECTAAFTSNVAGEVRPGSVGRPLPGYRVAIWDDDDRPLPAGERGRLAVVGPTGCRYLNDARQENYVRNGWNVTGDIFSLDADGFLWYHGRSDDLIITSGHKFYPVEVETVLLRHLMVCDCVVSAVAGPNGPSIVAADVVRANSDQSDTELRRELMRYMDGQVARYKAPRLIRFVPSIPRTATGKVRRPGGANGVASAG